MTAPRSVTLLDTEFQISAPAALLEYTRGFLDAYEHAVDPTTAAWHVDVDVSPGPMPDKTERLVPVHRSKHQYWTFSARAGVDPHVTVWPRGIAVRLLDPYRTIEVIYDPDVPSTVTGESLFHALRGLALYQRLPERGAMLHASAVVMDGRAVAFTGVAGAGKTSLLTALVRSGLAVPLSNDRIRVNLEASPLATTWPSYASYCEGTLQAIPELRQAATTYEDAPDNALRTQRWGPELKSSFATDCKRVYPMTWLTDALSCRYATAAPLTMFVVSRLDPAKSGREWDVLDVDADHQLLRTVVAGNRFDGHEPSFLPWHELAPVDASITDSELLNEMAAGGVTFGSLTIGPDALEGVAQHVNRWLACATT